MKITVAICTWNRCKLLNQALGRMTQLVIPEGTEWELLIVNNNCTDATDTIIKAYEDLLPIRRLFEPIPGKSNALNRAMQEASGEYILWTDDDVLVDPKWLSEYCRAFRYWPEVALFGGPIYPQFEGKPPKWLERTWRNELAGAYAFRDFGKEPFPLTPGNVAFPHGVIPYGANFAVRAKEQKAYPYDSRFGPRPNSFMRGEEVLVIRSMLREGIEGRWVPGAKVTHSIPKRRQNLKYLRHLCLADEEFFAGSEGTRPVEIGTKEISGRPRWLWRRAIKQELTYRFYRLISPPEIWINEFKKSCTYWGKVLHWNKYRPEPVKEKQNRIETIGRPKFVKIKSSDVPIFIVGVPRSGTTLLAALLGAHNRLSCGPETHFFVGLSLFDSDRLYNEQAWPDNALDFLESIPYFYEGSVLERYGIEREQIASYLKKSPPSVAKILSAVTETFGQNIGKSRWIEKTSNHLRHVREVRKYFPDSPIIRIVRDPRDVALSLIKMPWGRPSLIEALALWVDYDNQSAGFFRSDRLAYTIRYEDLLACPERELEKLCEFIGEEFDYKMLDTSASSMKYANWPEGTELKWANRIDPSRSRVWEKELTQDKNRLAEAFLGDRLTKYDYPVQRIADRFAFAFPSRVALVKNCPSISILLADEGFRFWARNPAEEYKALIYAGWPDASDWHLGRWRSERVFNTLKCMRTIAKTRISGKRIYWGVSNSGYTERQPGFCTRLIELSLRPFKIDKISELK